METIRKLTDIDPRDLPVMERVFGQRLDGSANVVFVMRTLDDASNLGAMSGDPRPIDEGAGSDELPEWCNVLEGMSKADRDEFRAELDRPVRMAHSE
jgi:hypothetical protein